MKGKKKVKEPAGMNIPEIFAALAMLEKERGIPQTFMMDKIIQAVTTAYKRDHKAVENVIVDVDEEHQRLKMYVQKNVVAEEDYVDPFNEIPVEEAKTISARYEIGDVVNIPVDNTEFGRIAAGNGKQVIIQGLREAERGMESIMALGRPTVNEFATFMCISPPNAAYKVNSLVKKGYIRKIQSPSDRREFHLEVTQKYIDYYNISSNYMSEVMDRIMARFSPEDCGKLEEILTVVSRELMPEVPLPERTEE